MDSFHLINSQFCLIISVTPEPEFLLVVNSCEYVKTLNQFFIHTHHSSLTSESVLSTKIWAENGIITQYKYILIMGAVLVFFSYGYYEDIVSGIWMYGGDRKNINGGSGCIVEL